MQYIVKVFCVPVGFPIDLTFAFSRSAIIVYNGDEYCTVCAGQKGENVAVSRGSQQSI